MSEHSSIEWTKSTWNPVRGCTKVSPGCKHCYAETFAERFRGKPGHPFEQGFDVRLVPEKLHLPLTWRSPRKVFVNSVSDLFHERVPTDYIESVGDVMRRANRHTYQVLTKRHARMAHLLGSGLRWMAELPNVWYGVSVEDHERAGQRLDALRRVPSRIRFVSFEPLLEDVGDLALTGIHWVIVGGESGPHARPMLPAWVENVQRQCASERIPFFFKQWGGTRKARAGRMLNGRSYDEYPS